MMSDGAQNRGVLQPIQAARNARANAMQRCMVSEVLHHREIEIERARLEYDAEEPQCGAGLTLDIVAKDGDAAGANRIEPAHEREQRAFAGTVEAEQGDKARGPHDE